MNDEKGKKKNERLSDLTKVIWEIEKALRQSEKLIEEILEEEFVLGGEFFELVEQVLYDLYKYNASVIEKLKYVLIKEYSELSEEGIN